MPYFNDTHIKNEGQNSFKKRKGTAGTQTNLNCRVR